MRIAQTLPRPMTPSTAMTTWAGRIMATAEAAKAASAQVGGRPPSVASPYIANRTAGAASP